MALINIDPIILHFHVLFNPLRLLRKYRLPPLQELQRPKHLPHLLHLHNPRIPLHNPRPRLPRLLIQLILKRPAQRARQTQIRQTNLLSHNPASLLPRPQLPLENPHRPPQQRQPLRLDALIKRLPAPPPARQHKLQHGRLDLGLGEGDPLADLGALEGRGAEELGGERAGLGQVLRDGVGFGEFGGVGADEDGDFGDGEGGEAGGRVHGYAELEVRGGR